MDNIILLNEIKSLKSLIIRGSKDVLTTSEAAQYLGIGKAYLYKLTSANRIPFYRPEGKMIFFKRTDLESFLLRNRVSSSEELQDKAISFVTNRKKGSRK